MGGGAPVHWTTSTFDGLYLINGVEGFMNSYVFIDTGNPVGIFVTQLNPADL